MKRKNSFVILAIFFIVATNFSCKKNSKAELPASVEYKITPLDSYILLLKYNDNTGNLVGITNPSQFINGGDQSQFLNGSKTISVSAKPFLAKIEITVLNTTTASHNYDLEILVDGLLKKTVTVNVPVNLNNLVTGSAEFTVP